jgi:hypothetical protein
MLMSFCVNVTVTKRTLVTFHCGRVCMVQHVIGPALIESLTHDQLCSASCDQRLPHERQVLLPNKYFTHVIGVTANISCVIKPTHTQP